MKLCITILIIVTIIELKETLGKRSYRMNSRGKLFPLTQELSEILKKVKKPETDPQKLINKEQKEQEKNQNKLDKNQGDKSQTGTKTNKNNDTENFLDENYDNNTDKKHGVKRIGNKIVVCQLIERDLPDAENYFFPLSIGPELCSHVNLNFGVLDPKTYTLKAGNLNNNVVENVFRKALILKKRGVKIIISLAPDDEAGPHKFGELISNSHKRNNFIDKALSFLQKYHLDGLDIDWVHPQCPGKCSGKTEYANFIAELSRKFGKMKYILSVKLYPQNKYREAYDLKELSAFTNYVIVMAYDFFPDNYKQVEHLAPLFNSTTGHEEYTVNYTVHRLLNSGLHREKFVLAIPFHGKIFRLKDKTKWTFGSPAVELDDKDEPIGSRKISFKEICYLVRAEGWKKVHHIGSVGQFSHKGDLWICYDNAKQASRKSNYTRDTHLKGVMTGYIEDDDYSNICCCEAFPLIKNINRILSGYPDTRKICF